MLRLAALGLVGAAALTCRSDDGSPVDWWLLVKAPAGTVAWTATPTQSLAPSPYSLNDTAHGALAYTLQSLWDPTIAAYALFNDEVPGALQRSSAEYGHTKGGFAIDTDGSAFWLTHSVPLFPRGPATVPAYAGLGSNAYTYGQTLFCVSLPGSTVNAMAGLVQLNRPQIYESYASGVAESLYPNVSALIHGAFSTEPRCLAEALGNGMTLVAKSREWGRDLYSECVSPLWSTSLWVESWIRGSAYGPTCPADGLDTLDVDAVRWGPGMEWSSRNDHSKWTVALNVSLVCFGDINRMTTQEARGGGTLCLTDAGLVAAARAAVQRVTPCGSNLSAFQ